MTVIGVTMASAEAGGFARRTIGLDAGYSSRGESVVTGIFFKYRFSRHFTIAPNVDYVFKHHNLDGYAFNLNTNFPIALGSPRVNFYPLVGVAVSSWNERYPDGDDATDDASTRTTCLGINAGAGFEVAVTPTLTLNLEGYYNWIKTYDGAYVKASIGYCF